MLQFDEVGGKRHAGGAELVQLQVYLLIELVQILGLLVHLAEQQADLRLQFLECHVSPQLARFDFPAGRIDGLRDMIQFGAIPNSECFSRFS